MLALCVSCVQSNPSAGDRVEASSVLHASLNCLSLVFIFQSNLTFLPLGSS